MTPAETKEDVFRLLSEMKADAVVKRVDRMGAKLPPMSTVEALSLGIALITGIRGHDKELGMIAEYAAVEIINQSIKQG